LILPDVNVLLYAFRSDSSSHGSYRKWLESVVNGQEAYAISLQVLASLVRISTHPKIFKQPSELAEALHFCDVISNQQQCIVITPGERHWNIFVDLCKRTSAAGNLIQDAWFAALAIESGSEWITTDRDYSRFPGLRWRTPF
jgi:uncharacterized protein